MKTLLKYPGSKWKIVDWIIDHFPEHKVYLEPFFGSGAVFFNKTPAYIETVNDVDGNIVNLFRVCRERPMELATALNLSPFSREEFVSCYEMKTENPVEWARRTVVRYHQSFGTS
ncbi:MAG: DNA adenine methylase, partial [Clostridia bacterium]|nr:DNA adenine methylase [Clostridia bacterium]